MKHIFVSALLAIGLASNAQSVESDTLLAKFFYTEELQEIIETKTTYYHCPFPNEKHVFDIVGDQEALSILLRADSIAVRKTPVSHWGGWDVMVFYFADNSYLYASGKEENGEYISRWTLNIVREDY